MDTAAPTERRTGAALATGFVAAILASACCLGPLMLITIGVSGAWIANLAALEPYRPAFVAAAVVALGLAARRLWAKPASCEPGRLCAAPRGRGAYRLLFAIAVALLALALVFPWLAPLWY